MIYDVRNTCSPNCALGHNHVELYTITIHGTWLCPSLPVARSIVVMTRRACFIKTIRQYDNMYMIYYSLYII